MKEIGDRNLDRLWVQAFIASIAGLRGNVETLIFLVGRLKHPIRIAILVVSVPLACLAWGKIGVLKDTQGKSWEITRHGATVFFKPVYTPRRPIAGITMFNPEVRKVRAMVIQVKNDKRKETVARMETSHSDVIKVEKKRSGTVILQMTSSSYDKPTVSFSVDRRNYTRVLQLLAIAGADDFKDKRDVKVTTVKVDLTLPKQ